MQPCQVIEAKERKQARESGNAPDKEGEREENTGDDLVRNLFSGFYASLEAARRHHQALKMIKELTGAKIDLPDINF